MGFANDIIGGAAALIRAAIKSPNYVTGSAGWSINKDGSAEFDNVTIRGTITAGTFNGANFVLNSSGLFVYSGTPALGNLIASDGVSAAGTDAKGNAYPTGTTSYNSGATFTAANLNGGIISWYTASSGAGPWTQQSDIGFSWNSVQGGSLLLQAAHQVLLGQTGNMIWDDLTQQLSIPAGGGPFIAGESFHVLSNPSGITGTARIKKMPWNAIWFEGDVTWSGTAGATLTFGAPPDSSYSPANSIRRPVASTGIPSALSAAPRLFIPAGGTGPQLITQTVTAANSQYGWSVIYPTN